VPNNSPNQIPFLQIIIPLCATLEIGQEASMWVLLERPGRNCQAAAALPAVRFFSAMFILGRHRGRRVFMTAELKVEENIRAVFAPV
jgi:hypothetical protein